MLAEEHADWIDLSDLIQPAHLDFPVQSVMPALN
jgi:hypothetical protein